VRRQTKLSARVPCRQASGLENGTRNAQQSADFHSKCTARNFLSSNRLDMAEAIIQNRRNFVSQTANYMARSKTGDGADSGPELWFVNHTVGKSAQIQRASLFLD